MYSLPRLYLITDRKACDDILFVVEEALKGGLRFLQLREKDLSTLELYDLSLELRNLTSRYGALLLINDRVDIALAVGADGVHIGKSSLSVSVVRRLSLGLDFIIGYSAHSVSEVLRKELEGVDFVTMSPIFVPFGKAYDVEPIGTGVLEELSLLSVPVYALGGVKVSNVFELKSAYGIALISEVMGSDNPGGKVRELFSAMSGIFL